MDNLLQGMATLMENNFLLAPILALLAGVLTSVSPCSLYSIPFAIAYLEGSANKDSKKGFKLSLVFSLGMAACFTVLGVISAWLGSSLKIAGGWFYIVIGILLILMGLQTYGVITLLKPTNLQAKNTKKGYVGAFLSGVLTSLFSSPCATPVLAALLFLVANKGSILWGIILLLLYSLGSAVVVILIGTSMGAAKKIMQNPKYEKTSNILKYIMGTIILIFGVYLIYKGI